MKLLKKEDDGYYLTLKRNRLKGGNKEVSYKISTDYYDVTYKIPEVLANEIMNYHDFTKQYEKTQIDTFLYLILITKNGVKKSI